MSLAELLPKVEALPRGEKFRLVRLLVEELEKEEADDVTKIIPPNQSYPVWSPFDAHEAAAAMQKMLDAAKEKATL
jgi:hypothetical protein